MTTRMDNDDLAVITIARRIRDANRGEYERWLRRSAKTLMAVELMRGDLRTVDLTAESGDGLLQ